LTSRVPRGTFLAKSGNYSITVFSKKSLLPVRISFNLIIVPRGTISSFSPKLSFLVIPVVWAICYMLSKALFSAKKNTSDISVVEK
jgi:hypothetical protein